MVGFLLGILINVSSAVTLESHCTKYKFNSTSIQSIELSKKECVVNKIDKNKQVDFIVSGFKKNQIITLSHKIDNVGFCDLPIDVISEINFGSLKSKTLWESAKNIRSTLFMTSTDNIIQRSTDASEKRGKNTCYAFPGFYRIKKFVKNMFPASLKELSGGGYMLLSQRNKTMFFFDQYLKSIVYSLDFSKNLIVKDALFEANGTLAILAVYINPAGSPNVCLQRWDIGTETLMSNICNIKNYPDQIILNIDGKIMHAYTEKGTLYLEKTGLDKVEPGISKADIGKFKLTNAFDHD